MSWLWGFWISLQIGSSSIDPKYYPNPSIIMIIEGSLLCLVSSKVPRSNTCLDLPLLASYNDPDHWLLIILSTLITVARYEKESQNSLKTVKSTKEIRRKLESQQALYSHHLFPTGVGGYYNGPNSRQKSIILVIIMDHLTKSTHFMVLAHPFTTKISG